MSIHPFGDGNGRVARALESFVLYRAGVNAFGFYSLANFYYRNRMAYINKLVEVRFRANGDLTAFALFALEGLVSELESVHHDIIQMVKGHGISRLRP